MRLSLRTLLAFEDNVFDVEQHRRLEQLLPADKNAEATLRRIRTIVRNPSLGVPGLVDHQEELDPNYVAEYLDHQMSGSVQEKFETYCLSADKYLAEIASIHHILSNVLGEPARTSRECRLKCYNVLHADTPLPSFSLPEPLTHFQPYDAPPESQAEKPTMKVTNRHFASLWQLLFPAKPVPVAPAPAPATSEEKRPPLWTFAIIGILICALLLGWQQLEKQRLAQQLREIGTEIVTEEPETVSLPKASEAVSSPREPEIVFSPRTPETAFQPSAAETPFPVAEHYFVEPPIADTSVAEAPETIAPPAPLAPFEPIEQVAFTSQPETSTSETFTPFTAAPTEDSNLGSPMERDDLEQPNVLTNDSSLGHTAHSEQNESEYLPTPIEEETIIAFQPIASLPRSVSEFPARPNDSASSSAWQPAAGQSVAIQAAESVEIQPAESIVEPAVSQVVSVAAAQHQPVAAPLTRAVGRVMQASPSDLIFSAATSSASWQLLSSPFDLNGDQYLLTAAPFRGTFELTDAFRIEMVGDAKLCILPLDASGIPGIFVDYGRIIIRPLRPNQPMRIEMERARGKVSSTGTQSVLFIDTFADVSEPQGARILGEQRPRITPILGFVPKNSEQIVWHSAAQPQPFYVNLQGSMLLQSERYRFGEVRNLPNWLGMMPMSPEEHRLAEICRRYFAEAHGNGEQALTQLVLDGSPAVRILGLRLWGDLGRFDVPIAAVAERRQGEESIRQVLNQYFEEVMRRDEETIQRFADAIQFVKEARREPL